MILLSIFNCNHVVNSFISLILFLFPHSKMRQVFPMALLWSDSIGVFVEPSFLRMYLPFNWWGWDFLNFISTEVSLRYSCLIDWSGFGWCVKTLVNVVLSLRIKWKKHLNFKDIHKILVSNRNHWCAISQPVSLFVSIAMVNLSITESWIYMSLISYLYYSIVQMYYKNTFNPNFIGGRKAFEVAVQQTQSSRLLYQFLGRRYTYYEILLQICPMFFI